MTSSRLPESDLERLRNGGNEALAELFSVYQSRLQRMVDFRLDARVAKRVDAADILQEAYLEAARRVPELLASPNVSFYVWLRQLTLQQILMSHRKHFRQKRDARQEVRLLADANSTSLAIADELASNHTPPSDILVRDEHFEKLKVALEAMDDIDREVLALRHFEQLGNSETAEVLGLSKTAASNRYVRAMQRLSRLLSDVRNARNM